MKIPCFTWRGLILIQILLFHGACYAGSTLPEQRPPDLSVSFSNGGGMRDQSYSLEIKKNMAHFSERLDGLKREFDFTLADGDLDRLYTILRNNRVDRIKTDGSFINDKGGYNFQVSWGREVINIGESGTQISGTWSESWQHVTLAFDQLIAEQKQKIAVPLSVSVDQKLKGRYFSAWVDNETISLGLMNPPQQKILRLIPGQYHLKAALLRLGMDPSKTYLAKSTDWTHLSQIIEVPREKSVRILYKDPDQISFVVE